MRVWQRRAQSPVRSEGSATKASNVANEVQLRQFQPFELSFQCFGSILSEKSLCSYWINLIAMD